MGSPLLVVVVEDAGGELSVGVIGFPTEAVCPHVRGTADVLDLDGDVVLVDEEEDLSQLGHHGKRSRREVGENSHHGLIVLVEE